MSDIKASLLTGINCKGMARMLNKSQASLGMLAPSLRDAICRKLAGLRLCQCQAIGSTLWPFGESPGKLS